MSKLNNTELEEFICSAYQNRTHTITQMQQILGIYPNAIYKIFRKHGIKLRGSNLPKEKALKICEQYNKGKTIKEIHNELSISESCILKILKKYEVKTRKQRFKRIYPLDETIFEKIDTFEKAQFLGLVYADGSMSKYNTNISIRLREDDKDYLNEWREKLLKTTKPLGYTFRSQMVSPLNGKTYQTPLGNSILDVTSLKAYKDAKLLGLCPNKSKADLPMPAIPDNLKIAFILGLFEGDGGMTSCQSNYSQSFNIACQKNMGLDLKRYFDSIGIFSSFYERKFICLVHVRRKEDLKRLYHLLYDNATIVMKRKKDKFKAIIDNF